MLLYVNGDELSGGACAINDFVCAADDIHYTASGNKSHPDNIMHSYGYYLSKMLNLGYRCEAKQQDSNLDIYNSVIHFVEKILPTLRSQYTVIVVGWMPDPKVDLLNTLADILTHHNIDYAFFNTKKPLQKSAQLTFKNCIDLTNKDECLLTWCKNNGHEVKNNKFPDANSHNAWAKYMFNRLTDHQLL